MIAPLSSIWNRRLSISKHNTDVLRTPILIIVTRVTSAWHSRGLLGSVVLMGPNWLYNVYLYNIPPPSSLLPPRTFLQSAPLLHSIICTYNKKFFPDTLYLSNDIARDRCKLSFQRLLRAKSYDHQDDALCTIFTILLTLWNSEQKSGLLIKRFCFFIWFWWNLVKF